MLSVYKASAGSGKTYTLTGQYIKLLLGEKDPATGRYRLNRRKSQHRHTLAITFTNKATEEMKRRIVHQMAVLAGMEPGWKARSCYEAELTSEFGCSPDELKEVAAGALRNLLLEFNRFNVTTIDSFFQMVLRSFAREAELTGNYEVELDNMNVIKHATASVLQSLNAETHTTEGRRLVDWLSQLMMRRIEEGQSFNIFNRNASVFGGVAKFVRSVTGEEFESFRTEMMDYLSDHNRLLEFQKRVSDERRQLELKMTRECRIALRYIEENGMDKRVKKPVLDPLTRCAVPDPHFKLGVGPGNALKDISYIYSSKKDTGDPALELVVAPACRAIVERYAYDSLFNEIIGNMYMLGLLSRILDKANEQLITDNRLQLSDTNHILSRIIGEGDAPFVYERVGMDLHHFLIDEFQDTSRLQWNNLRILVEEGLSQGYDSLVIGDEKQCIYRFRNSDPDLLKSQLECDLPGHYTPRGTGPESNTNWRSSRHVVEFNNMLFDALSARMGFADIYSNVKQGIPPKHSDFNGYVTVNVTDGVEQSISNMIDHMERQLNSGYQPGDIAVLVRFRSEAAPVIDAMLQLNERRKEMPEVRVVSDDSVSIDSSPTVRLIMSILRLMASPGKKEHDSTADTPRRRLAKLVNMFETQLNAGLTRSKALEQVLAMETADNGESASDGEYLGADTILAGGVMSNSNILSTVETIIGSPVVDAMALKAENAFISSFQDLVLDYTNRGGSNLLSFVRWWDTTGHKSPVTLPPDRNAIRVMTIHKSKGLEFECVHIPFASWKLFRAKGTEWFDISAIPMLRGADVPPAFPIRPRTSLLDTVLAPQYEALKQASELDELNVAYVAFTRAVSELNVSINASSSGTLGNLLTSCLTLDSNGQFEAGHPTHRRTVKEGELHAALEPSSVVEMPPYVTHAHEELWKNTRLDPDENVSAQRLRGREVHHMLAHVRSMADIHIAAGRCVADGDLLPDGATRLAEHITGMIERHGVRRWYEGYKRVLCEREIVGWGRSAGIPDRVVWLADGTVEVIDYKTGHDDDNRYSRQVRRYMRALRRITGQRVRGYIWYLDGDRIIEVAQNQT